MQCVFHSVIESNRMGDGERPTISRVEGMLNCVLVATLSDREWIIPAMKGIPVSGDPRDLRAS